MAQVNRSTLLLGWVIIAFVAACSGGSNQEEAPKAKDFQSDSTSSAVADENVKYIVFFGNSLTAGYGLKPSEGFTALIQKRIDSLNLPYEVVNAGLSGETTSGGKNRIDWVLKQPVDIFVLELGGNDVLRGLDLSATKDNLESIILSVKGKYPEARIILAGMQAPPNMGKDYIDEFNDIYPALAQEHETHLIPFFLENVGGIDSLNLEDGIHPNVAGQKILLENVWQTLEPLLEK